MVATAQQQAMAQGQAAVTRRRFTVEEYHRMGEAGVLPEGERVELLDGEIVAMSPIGIRHMQGVNRLNKQAASQIGAGLIVSVQNPIGIANGVEVQPDLAILQDRDYESMPTSADILLVIEVADSSRAYDRETKMPLYGAAGIAEAWLVDLIAGTIERYSEPRDGRYTRIAIAGRGETIASTVLPDLTPDVDTVLGPARS